MNLKYQILENTNITKLSKDVTKLIANGWELHGNLIVTNVPTEETSHSGYGDSFIGKELHSVVYYTQAMKKL